MVVDEQTAFEEGVIMKVSGVEQSVPIQVLILQLSLVLYPSPTFTAQTTSVAVLNV